MAGYKESGALKYEQLSDDEVDVIGEIESRLKEAQKAVRGTDDPVKKKLDKYLADVDDRHPRVLLLDGGRGTGKTSLLLTMIERWNFGGQHDGEQKREPSGNEKVEALYAGRPDHITVVRNLDFDPLPPGMPVIAGLVQAWRLIAEAYDKATNEFDCDDDNPTLSDDWHSLFSMAASGWSEVPGQRGFVEQVLDREQQVQDWLDLSKKWRCFIDRLIECGRCVKKGRKLAEKPVFVVVIDDCDLQVNRVREILPALRMLYHPNVFFLVAAHKPHMVDMLRSDFLGQERRLANSLPSPGEVADTGETTWSSRLAGAAFEKTFPKGNQWHLRSLSLREFLAFPDPVPSDGAEPSSAECFLQQLNFLVPADGMPSTKTLGAGSFLWSFAARTEELGLPGVMTYRRAHQLMDYAARIKSSDPYRAALEVLAGLFAPFQDEDDVSVRPGGRTVDVGIVGKIASLFRPEIVDFRNFNFVRSTRPDFVFRGTRPRFTSRMSERQSRDVNFTPLLIAKALEEKKYPIYAAGLQWDTYLSLAWTEWGAPPASFSWNRHKHPRPDELLRQVEEWSSIIRQLRQTEFDPVKHAFAWLHYQKRWSSPFWADASEYDETNMLNELKTSTLDNLGTPGNWSSVKTLTRSHYPKKFSKEEFKAESVEWVDRTLPLLARPEIGFPPLVQRELLAARDKSRDVSLRSLRRRYFTDGYIAANVQRGGQPSDLPTDEEVESFIRAVDEEYRSRHGGENLWSEIEDS